MNLSPTYRVTMRKKNISSEHHEQTNSRQQRFSTQVLNLVKIISDFGNPFLEQSQDLLVLDTRNVMPENAINTVNNIENIGMNLFRQYFEHRLTSRNKSLFDPISKNKLPIFSRATTKIISKDNSEVVSLKKNCQLFSQLYISCQVRDGNLEEFFHHENQTFPPALSKDGTARSGTKLNLLTCLEEIHISTQDIPVVDCVIHDGPAIVNILSPAGCATFQDYASKIFFPFVNRQLDKCSRVDIVWDIYRGNSLMVFAREKRGQGIRHSVLPDSKIPSNWHSFLSVNENKVELFKFLVTESSNIETSKTV